MPFAKQLKVEVGVIATQKKLFEILHHYNNLLAIFYYSTTVLSYFPCMYCMATHIVESQTYSLTIVNQSFIYLNT